jgi:hypothetical protein
MPANRFILSAVLILFTITGFRYAAAAPQDQVAPADVISRDAQGQITIRAVRLAQPLKIDGRLDEDIYRSTAPATGFRQQFPRYGEPATEQTEFWVLFDSKNFYVSARCYDSHPEREVVNEMRRDGPNLPFNENITLVIDTLHDQRNGFWFQTTPLSAIRDQSVIDGVQNQDWNTVLEVKGSRFEGGWITEMAIPFKSLRYAGAGPQTWGINVRRVVRWKNETSTISPIPAALGLPGMARMSTAATLIGLETPAQSMNLEVKPYVLSTLTTNRAAKVPINNALEGQGGFDFKYGLTRSLIADFTYNTDFAQVEEDLQQVNLTRFNLQFREKRDFFLEGPGLFSFGSPSSNVPVLFFSRQIGLSQGQSVPVIAGARVSGKAGPFGIGALNIQTGDKPEAGAASTNFSVLRLKRDILRRSNMGMVFTRRTPTVGRAGTNLAGGIDANLLLYEFLTVSGYYAKTSTPGFARDDGSYRARVDYGADRYGFVVEHLLVAPHFSPEIGFLRRSDFRESFAQARFSPRVNGRRIRQITSLASMDYITDAHRTVVEDRNAKASFGIEFQNGDNWISEYTHNDEFLPKNFNIAAGVIVPRGVYSQQAVKTSYLLGQQRRISGTVAVSRGTLYGGDQTETTYSGRISLIRQLALEPSYTLDWIDLPFGNFTSKLIANRFSFTPSPHVLLSSLVQYNSADHSVNSSVRLRWEYAPRSEIFVVYSDGRGGRLSDLSELQNRSLAVKITRLLRF